MMKTQLIALGLLTVFSACNSTQKSNNSHVELTEKVVSGMKVEKVTIQEWITGIEGGTNVIEFRLNIQSEGDSFQPDSVFYKEYQCAIFLKDEVKGTYAGKVKKQAQMEVQPSAAMKVSFKDADFKFSIPAEKVKVLKPAHMP